VKYDEYTKRIDKELGLLSQEEKVVLCLICCARLFPLYEVFSEKEDWGDASILAESQSFAKKWLRRERLETKSLVKSLGSVIPDMDDFGSCLGSYALNAGLAHEHLLEQMESNDSAPAFYALLSCYDTIDFYVQELLDPDSKGGVQDIDIEIHAMMSNETKWQFNIFSEIKNSKVLEKFADNYETHAIINLA